MKDVIEDGANPRPLALAEPRNAFRVWHRKWSAPWVLPYAHKTVWTGSLLTPDRPKELFKLLGGDHQLIRHLQPRTGQPPAYAA